LYTLALQLKEEMAMSGTYKNAYEQSIKDPNGFWMEHSEAIDWIKKPTKALDDSGKPVYRWFPDAELNTSYNAIDRHIAQGRGEQRSLTPTTSSLTR
jgi:propionyl-CoA synthetase